MASKQIDVVIPAAGLGRRMKSRGPKALTPVDGEPLVLRQIRLVREAYPVASVVVVTGYETERMRDELPPDVTVVFNRKYESTNVAHSVAMGLRRCKHARPALIVYGDIAFNAEAIAGLPLAQSTVIVGDDEGRELEVGVNVQKGVALRFDYSLPRKWAHICLLASREKKLFLKAAARAGREMYFGYEILNDVIDAGGVLRAASPGGMKLVEIDCAKDVERLRLLTARETAVC